MKMYPKIHHLQNVLAKGKDNFPKCGSIMIIEYVSLLQNNSNLNRGRNSKKYAHDLSFNDNNTQ